MPGPTFLVGSLTYVSDLNTLSNAILTPQKQGVNFSAVRGFWYLLTAAALTVLMPPTPAAGDLVRASPATSAVNSVTFGRNGNNIDSTAADLTITGPDRALHIWLVYVDASIGWRSIQSTAGWFQFGGAVNANFNAAKSTAYVATASTFTATLPPTPAAGDQVKITTADHTVSGITLGRNGSNINGVAADFLINAKGWEVLATYVNASIGWLLVFDSTINPQPRYDSAINELRYHDTQRERSDAAGWMPWAYPMGIGGADTIGTAVTALPVSGGSIATPVQLTSHMLLDGLSIVNGDITGAHTLEWRLYKQQLNNGNAGEATLAEVPSANGTFSFTPGAAGVFTSPASAVTYLAPGLYWVVIRNTSATVTAALRQTATGTFGSKNYQTKTLGSGLSSTLDLVTGWTQVAAGVLGTRFNGRVLGQVSATFI